MRSRGEKCQFERPGGDWKRDQAAQRGGSRVASMARKLPTARGCFGSLSCTRNVDKTGCAGCHPSGGCAMRARALDSSASQTGARPGAIPPGADPTGLADVRRSEQGVGRVLKAVALHLTGLMSLAAPLCGCIPFKEYVQNGFKVGPNYARPPVPVSQDWIDAPDARLRRESGDLSKWWGVFKDPVLVWLICNASQQNLSLREAGMRVLQARAQLGIATGNLFPQIQQAKGDYYRYALSTQVANRRFNPETGTPTAGGLERFYGQRSEERRVGKECRCRWWGKQYRRNR